MSSDLHSIARLWWSDGIAARLARTALLPLEGGYRALVAIRGTLYDRGMLESHPSRIPVVSVGNLTVGGTGKTPVAAWMARRLLAQGAEPAIVLRGYGDDEPLVHRELNPQVPVVVSPDRVLGVAEAAEGGSTVAVLDDAFQHRRARRDVDIVLVSADRWTGRRRLIPAGPFREPIGALRRASLVIVTRKAVSREEGERVRGEVAALIPGIPVAMAHLRLGEVCTYPAGKAGRASIASLEGTRVLAVAAVGDPRAYIRQLTAAGAQVRFSIFTDHHAFTAEEAAGLAASLEPGERLICTLKDAVKLGPQWPDGAPPLWYVSQQVLIEEGSDIIDSLFAAILHRH
jgi:tetraacyldisaccharide 4'-kinase